MPFPLASRASTVWTAIGPGRFSHQSTPTASPKATMPMATGQNRDVDSGSLLRSMRKSSTVGFGELIDNGRAQGTAFSPQGQLWSARLAPVIPPSFCWRVKRYTRAGGWRVPLVRPPGVSRFFLYYSSILSLVLALFARPAPAAVREIHAVRRQIQRRAGKIGWARDLAALHLRPVWVREPAPLALRERPGKDYGPWTQCYVGKASSCTVPSLTSGTIYNR